MKSITNAAYGEMIKAISTLHFLTWLGSSVMKDRSVVPPSTPGPTAATTPTASNPASNGRSFWLSSGEPKYLPDVKLTSEAFMPTKEPRFRQSIGRHYSLASEARQATGPLVLKECGHVEIP